MTSCGCRTTTDARELPTPDRHVRLRDRVLLPCPIPNLIETSGVERPKLVLHELDRRSRRERHDSFLCGTGAFLDNQRDGLPGKGEEMAPVRVTRRKIGPVVICAVSSQARIARTGHGRGGSAYTTSSS